MLVVYSYAVSEKAYAGTEEIILIGGRLCYCLLKEEVVLMCFIVREDTAICVCFFRLSLLNAVVGMRPS